MAQENPEGEVVFDATIPAEAPDEFGSGITIHNVAPNAFVPRVATWADCQLFFASHWQPTPTTATCFLGGNFELPAGTLLVSAEIFYNDANAAGNPSLIFTRTNTAGTPTTLASVTFPAGAPGNTSVLLNFPAGTAIDNLNNVYGIEMSLPPTTRFYRARLRFQRQVSAAPAVATFPNDVPTSHPFFRFVEALAASGVTGGCGAGSYCPDDAVTRGQMAVFLAAALGLHFPN
jgi:hypothetical protein